MDIKDLTIDRIGLSVRSRNALYRANVHTVGDLLSYTEDSLRKLRNVGNTSVREILAVIEKYRCLDEQALTSDSDEEFKAKSDTPKLEDYDAWIASASGREFICAWMDKKDVGLEALESLSARAYNLLRLNGYKKLQQVIFVDKNDLMRLPHMNSGSTDDIEQACQLYLQNNRDEIQKAYEEGSVDKDKDKRPLTVFEMLRLPEYHDSLLTFVKENDKGVQFLGLSVRAKNRLSEQNLEKLSDIIFYTREELLRIPGTGSGTADEIFRKIQDYLIENEDRIIAACSGDEEALLDDQSISERILSQFRELGFRGLSLQEIKDRLHLPELISETRLKHIIGKLLAAGELEYVDFRCYRIFKRFSDQLALCDTLSDRSRDIIKRRLQGKTLEEIGRDLDLTRERVRQIVKRDVQKVCEWNEHHTGESVFDEDYYRYFFETYAFDKNDAAKWFGMTPDICRYLEMRDVKHGKRDLQAAIDDYQNLDVGLRIKIKNYLNRDKLFIDGMWVEKRRASLEEVVIRKFCQNSVSFDEFAEIYNKFLEQEEIAYDEQIYYTDLNYRTRKNHLSDERYLLWKQNEQIRYYDIDGRDYTELFDALNMDAYENIELSTMKFVEDYSEIMEKYDIRDQYELHNLLRKVVPEGSFHDFHCGRMPMIRFGEFDRDAAILDILIDNAPISAVDLCAILHKEYGYDPSVVLANYLHSFNDYYFKGTYIVDQKAMPMDRKSVLTEDLTDDFYYIDEIRRKYITLFPDADPEEVNPYNLKTMGFLVYARYALQHYNTLDDYFEDILTRNDVTDLVPIRKRFAYVRLFSQKLMELKRDLQVIEFEPNQLIHFRRLEQAGITREMVWEFCDRIYEYVEDGAYFSAALLRKGGFVSELYDLGFSDWFYANLLIADPRFSFGTMFGSIILYKGRQEITIKSFETYLIKKYGSIDTYDLMTEMTDNYGCCITDHLDVIYKIRGTEVYYDRILDRLYANARIYDQEIEKAGVI